MTGGDKNAIGGSTVANTVGSSIVYGTQLDTLSANQPTKIYASEAEHDESFSPPLRRRLEKKEVGGVPYSMLGYPCLHAPIQSYSRGSRTLDLHPLASLAS